MRGVIGFVVVIGTILVIAKVLKTNQRRKHGAMPRGRGRGRDSGLVEVISTTPLGPNRQLHLVRIGDEVILVGSGEGGITPLRKFDEDEAVALGVIDPAEDHGIRRCARGRRRARRAEPGRLERGAARPRAHADL